MFDLLVIGGGAAGFYGAIHASDANPNLRVAILEKGREVLSKVRVSGGGRCNVAHAEFDAGELAANYPRGDKELLGPFHHYGSADTMAFFQKKGIPLKVESDGRIFPESDSSQTIIDCFLKEIKRLNIQLFLSNPVLDLGYCKENKWWNVTTKKDAYQARNVLLATGGNQKVWHLLQRLGHTIVPPVPSLFTFNINDVRLKGLQGVSTPAAVGILEKSSLTPKQSVSLKSFKGRSIVLESSGPLLITHWGISGPAVLRLSAWGARLLNECNYKFTIRINWLPDYLPDAVLTLLGEIREIEARKTIFRTQAFELPRRLWARLVLASGIPKTLKWADLTKRQIEALNLQLTASEFEVSGKSTFKEEFVTAGGVDLRELDLRTFGSKKLPNLFLAGEVINVDGITGGFNFQNAWTGAFLAARAINKLC